MTDLCPRSYFGLCGGRVCVSDLCRHSFTGVCRGGVCVSGLCHRRYFGLCRGPLRVSEDFLRRVSRKSALQEYQRMSYKSVK